MAAETPAGTSIPVYFTSLWPVCFLHVLQNFEVSSRSVCLRRFFVVV